jgi:hypothetical protein
MLVTDEVLATKPVEVVAVLVGVPDVVVATEYIF